jgi:hypothetical protein
MQRAGDQRPWRLRRRQGQQLIAGSRIDPWRRQPRLADAEASIAIDRPFSILAVDGVVPHVRAVVQPPSFGNALAPVKTKQAGRAMAGTGRPASQVTAGLTCERGCATYCYHRRSALLRGSADTRVGYEGARERGSEAIGEIEPGCRDCHVPRVCADPTLTAGAAGRADRASPVTKETRQRQRHQAKVQPLPRREHAHAYGPNGCSEKKGSRQQACGGCGRASEDSVEQCAGQSRRVGRAQKTLRRSRRLRVFSSPGPSCRCRVEGASPPRSNSNLPPALRLDKRPHRHKQGRDSALKQPLRLSVCAATAQQGARPAGQPGSRAAGQQYRATAIQGNTGRGSRTHTGCRGGADGRRGHQLMGTGAGSGLETRNVRYRLCSARLVGVVAVGSGSG